MHTAGLNAASLTYLPDLQMACSKYKRKPNGMLTAKMEVCLSSVPVDVSCYKFQKNLKGLFVFFKFSFLSQIISTFNEGGNLLKKTCIPRKRKKITCGFLRAAFFRDRVTGGTWSKN